MPTTKLLLRKRQYAIATIILERRASANLIGAPGLAQWQTSGIAIFRSNSNQNRSARRGYVWIGKNGGAVRIRPRAVAAEGERIGITQH